MAPAKGKKAKPLPPAPVVKKGIIKKVKKVEKRNEASPKNFRVGGAIQPKRDLSRFVRWPKYIRIQRQKRVLLQRLKVPPGIAQFSDTLNKNQASELLKLLNRYKPETSDEKKERLTAQAHRQEGEQKLQTNKRPVMLKYGLNHVTDLVELKKAKLVVIAHDVEPVELIVWLPALCRKKGVPYCIVKGKSRLGKLVHKKNTCVVAIDSIRKEDAKDFEVMCKNFRAQFNDEIRNRRKWGGGIMGLKSQHAMQKRDAEIQLEQAKKLNMANL